MYIDEYLSEHGRDFSATMKCEHCGETHKLTTGYNDSNYHNNVIPAMVCKGCGKNAAGGVKDAPAVATKPKTFFATFGSGKVLGKRYVGIICKDEHEAHLVMHEIFGAKWGFIYPGNGLVDQVRKYHLAPLVYVKAKSCTHSVMVLEEATASEYLETLEGE